LGPALERVLGRVVWWSRSCSRAGARGRRRRGRPWRRDGGAGGVLGYCGATRSAGRTGVGVCSRSGTVYLGRIGNYSPARPPWARRLSTGQYLEFFIFILSRFCKNIWSGANFAKIYIGHRGPRRQGHNAVGPGARCRQEWALSPNDKGHGVTSLTPWPAALGA
jgi:hypothetical protein